MALLSFLGKSRSEVVWVLVLGNIDKKDIKPN